MTVFMHICYDIYFVLILKIDGAFLKRNGPSTFQSFARSVDCRAIIFVVVSDCFRSYCHYQH